MFRHLSLNEKDLPRDDDLHEAIVNEEHDEERTPWDGILSNNSPTIEATMRNSRNRGSQADGPILARL
jgi:hypothetical protein